MKTEELEITDFVNYLAKSQQQFKNLQPPSPSVQNLKELIKYTSLLRDSGTLDDDQFSTLLVYACSLFIEREVEERIKKVLGDKIPFLFILNK
jgi:hypothetical protein